ncbi:hypothetical protein FGIG_03964 [Fasciola gigantica]|uniref:Uncharacterized protein n=1 Tax=Fasciola gigantica TaxID=46835 RepID=A0A504Y495_FASGI|nr:hypothetical protein FGIG_03964 [Fasciola gigantica]
MIINYARSIYRWKLFIYSFIHLVVLAIVLDSECRKRRNRAKCKSIITSHMATEKPEIINWRDIEVGAPIRTPTTPNNFHEDNILEEDEEDMVEAEPLDFEPAYSTGHGDVGDDDNANKQRPLSEILIDRLEDVKEEDEVHAYESPLDYGYEGGDDSESTRPNE